MIRIIGKIPSSVTVACSGGIDSMVIVHFLRQSHRKVNLAYFNHDTRHSQKAQVFVEDYAKNNNLNLLVGGVKGYKGRQSLEEFWRNERYRFFAEIESDYIITCHHLDDSVETWVMSSLHGQCKLIPARRGKNIYRPFLMTSKKVIKDYAARKGVDWVEDPSNKQGKHMRNYVRHRIMPHILHINPGIRTMIRKKLIETYL